jgi:hypothetical protein
VQIVWSAAHHHVSQSRKAALARALRNFRELKISDKASFETDGGAFALAGLPGITLRQDSPDYRYTVHSAADTLDTVKPEVLAQNATIMATTAFWLADARSSELWVRRRRPRAGARSPTPATRMR